MPRSESPQPRRGRRGGRRTWVTVDGGNSLSSNADPGDTGPDSPGPDDTRSDDTRSDNTRPDDTRPDNSHPGGPATPVAPPPAADPYTPRRRYPWHDDPDYDPTAHRRTPPPSTWTPPPGPPRTPPAAPPFQQPQAPQAPAHQPPAPQQPRQGLPPTRPMPQPGQTGQQSGQQPGPPRQQVEQPGPPSAQYVQQADQRGPQHPPQHTQHTPPPADARDDVPWSAAGPPPVGTGAPTGDAPADDDTATAPTDDDEQATPRLPRKITVTRVAAMRSREFAQGGIRAFQRAATADGADRSGLTALTYATMMTYAVDAAVSVALANTLFFAAATAESKTNVALYLLITVAPFAVVAPVIGPLLDRMQRGRRAALAVSFGGRAVLAVVMAFYYDTWLLYPAALGMLVLSKSFSVLKSAVTPRVLPATITLVTTNSRLTVFGLAAGGVFGAVAAGIAGLFGSPGALFYTAVLAVGGIALCLRIPSWVESTAGEVPAALRTTKRGRRRPMGRNVAVSLWGNGSIRVLTGFLTLFVAFVVKSEPGTDAKRQLFLIGIVGAAAGIGSFVGNGVGSRQQFGRSDTVIIACIGGAVAIAATAAVIPGIATAAAVGLIAATASALAKVCLDAVIQRDLPDESRASAFGRSETVLQLAWVFGGALGVLLPHSTYWIGFAVVTAVVALGGVQTVLVSRGRSMLPFLGRRSADTEATEPARTGT